jgi:uncharacterized LabA/DUF88 family protein
LQEVLDAAVGGKQTGLNHLTGHAPWAPGVAIPGVRSFWRSIVNRTVFLVDGFNVHHSLLDAERVMRRSLHRLDVAGLCASYLHVLPGRSTEPLIVYFSALAHHLEQRRPGQRARQVSYLSALRSTGVDVRLGRFKAKDLTCPLCARRFTRYEEKETDVALGVHLLEFALQSSCGAVVLVSGDSDLVPALVAARRLAPSTTLAVGLPFGRSNVALERVANLAFTIKPAAYARHQLAPGRD